MKNTLPLLCLAFLLAFCSQEKKLLRKASNAVDKSDFDKAITYYDQIIEKDDKSFHGYAGKGIVLSEFQGRHEQAIPYLEKALANSPEKSKPILHSDLGKSYQFIGNYKRALQYYGKINNDPKYNDYDEFLTKRIADCKYAIDHPNVATSDYQDVKNIGGPVNTEAPEYTPVFSNGVMYFTSKRQDDPKEKKNGIDGKYFESIYTSKLEAGNWSQPVKFDLPKGMQMRKFGEAVASITPDGQRLFIYKAGKIYETDINNTDHMNQLDKNINLAGLMNHAALSPDGKTMYFTSEAEKGNGGSDIYVSYKKDDGSWGDPLALPASINTSYDEEAPFVTADGVLYFASNGHPGYGGFDIYKTQKVKDTWMKPENLGQPINSPGDDIFFTLLNNTSNGYYASARPGGKGDLDIYKVHYLRTENVECKPTDLMTINATPDASNPLVYNVQLQLDENMKKNIRSYRWDMDGTALAHTGESFQHTFSSNPETHKINARIVTYCDTCPTLNAWCAEKSVTIENKVLATNNNTTSTSSKFNDDKKGSKKAGKKGKENDDNIALNEGNSGSKKGKNKKDQSGGENTGTADNSNSGKDNSGKNASGDNNNVGSESLLDESKLKELNWNSTPLHFAYNEFNIKSESKSILDENINILKNNNNLTIVISGYADSRGSEEYNKTLSGKRANAVKQYLLSKGVSNKRIKGTKAMGETELLNNCTDGTTCDDAQHEQNRRVKLDVMDHSKSTASK